MLRCLKKKWGKGIPYPIKTKEKTLSNLVFKTIIASALNISKRGS